MKQIMNKTWLAVCLLACFLSLAACGKKDGGADQTVDQEARNQIQQIMTDFVSEFNNQTDEEMDQIKEQLQASLEQQALAPLQIQLTVAMIESMDNWQAVKADTGKLLKIDDMERWTITRGPDGEYEVTAGADYEKRRVQIQVTLNENISTLVSGFQFHPEYSVAENLESAGMNTLIGMGTVFAVLIFISLLISCFVFINRAEARMKAKSRTEVLDRLPERDSSVPAPADVQENLVDDLELVAVITAAIAAAESTSADGLVVRSIRRAPANRWKKA